jgi:ABC-type uncharacterized transport system involved in gliding motility auxiliary subunit
VARKRALTASTIAAGVVLAVALVAMIYWLGYRHYVRGDWTASKIYSLSEKTDHVLKDVKTDVHVIVFMTPQTPLFEETKELLQRYQAANHKISVEYIDPERQPLKTQQLAKQYGVSAANTVVFVSGDHTKYVTSDQLAEYDYSGMRMGQQPRLKGFKGEEQFTAAILAVENPKQPDACFTTGHGEHDLDSGDEEGLSHLKQALGRDNFKTEKVSLLAGEVPKQCDVLVVAGPTAPFTDHELAAFKSYVEGGGRAFVMLDPVLGGQQRPSGLAPTLKDFGVEVQNDLVVDPARRLPFYDVSAVYASDFRTHPVTEGMQGLAVLLPVARSVTTVEAKNATSTILLTTSKEGWGETDLAGILARKPISKDEKDVQGPVSLAVAAQSEKDRDNGWRMVVVGDSDFVSNEQLANAGNLNLALNAVNWLAKREQALGIAPRTPEQVSIFLSQAQMRTVTLISLVGLPGLAVMLGVVVWWRRRH